MKRGLTSADIPDSIKNAYSSLATTVVKKQDYKTSSENEIQVDAVFLGFPIYTTVDGKKQTVIQTMPPAVQMGTVKSGDRKGQPFPKPLSATVHVTGISGFGNQVKELEDGSGWKVLVNLDYHPNAKAWLLENYKDYYAGTLSTKMPLSEFISNEGEILNTRWVTVRRTTPTRVEVNDGVDSMFRATTANGKSLEIGPRSEVRFASALFSQYVQLKPEEKDKKDPDPTGYYVSAYTTVKAKRVRPSESNDPNMPIAERIRRQMSPDVHSMIPIVDFAAGKDGAKWDTFLVLRPTYQSEEGSPEGITWMSMPSDDERNFVSKHDNGQIKVFVTYRGICFQWKNSSGSQEGRQIYSVKVIGFDDIWKSFGIHHIESYVNLMRVNPIWAYAEVNLYKKDTMQYEENLTMIKQAEDGNAAAGASSVNGYYTFAIKTIKPDYLGMLPCCGFAVSQDWVKDKFSDYVGSRGKGPNKQDTLVLNPADPGSSNTFHHDEGGINAAVLSFGHPNHHGFAGDVWAEMSSREFFVLTGAQLNEDAPIGARTDKAESEAYLDNLIETHQGLSWWVFAVKSKALDYATVKVERPTKVVKRVKQEEEGEEYGHANKEVSDADADAQHESMDMDEEEDERPAKPKKKAGRAPATSAKKKK